MILLIDNYDSFTYNVYQYLGEVLKSINSEEEVKVVRNDKITLEELESLDIKGIIISPGPGRPEDAGICIDVIKKFGRTTPILGICLGHQAIGYAYGGEIKGAGVIMHGKISTVTHEGTKLFKDVKSPLKVARYHSLVIDKNTVPEELAVTAETSDGVIMAVKHKEYEVYGIQFHPESILTEQGMDMIRNFVGGICNVTGSN
ncbi:MAG: aminodeoxychorismate/anthranilate synthase component II [Bacillota bacterium]|nr:aminodeoxychorismate/anthranilate synthase component II [Bacillota bacterium]